VKTLPRRTDSFGIERGRGGERAAADELSRASGTLVTFGAMSLQPLKIPNGLLISRICVSAEFGLTNGTKRHARRANGRVSSIFRNGGRGCCKRKSRSYPTERNKGGPVEHAATRSAAAKSFSSLEPVKNGMRQSREAVIRIHFSRVSAVLSFRAAVEESLIFKQRDSKRCLDFRSGHDKVKGRRLIIYFSFLSSISWACSVWMTTQKACGGAGSMELVAAIELRKRGQSCAG